MNTVTSRIQLCALRTLVESIATDPRGNRRSRGGRPKVAGASRSRPGSRRTGTVRGIGLGPEPECRRRTTVVPRTARARRPPAASRGAGASPHTPESCRRERQASLARRFWGIGSGRSHTAVTSGLARRRGGAAYPGRARSPRPARGCQPDARRRLFWRASGLASRWPTVTPRSLGWRARLCRAVSLVAPTTVTVRIMASSERSCPCRPSRCSR